jgi:hypothetical protein
LADGDVRVSSRNRQEAMSDVGSDVPAAGGNHRERVIGGAQREGVVPIVSDRRLGQPVGLRHNDGRASWNAPSPRLAHQRSPSAGKATTPTLI